jgi:hypothetical protein
LHITLFSESIIQPFDRGCAAAVSGLAGKCVLLCPGIFKITIAGANGILPGHQFITVHGDAHNAPRIAPLGASLPEDMV